MELMEYATENVKDKPKNFKEVVQFAAKLQEIPNLSVERYCEILRITKPTFYKRLALGRKWGLLHQRFYKVHPQFEKPVYTVDKLFEFVKEPYLPVEKLAWLVLNTKDADKRIELASRFVKRTDAVKMREAMALYSMVLGFAIAYKDLPVVDFSPSDDEINSILNPLV